MEFILCWGRQIINALVCAKSLQLCPTICDLMVCDPPGSSVHEILQAKIQEWIAIFPSRGLSKIEPESQSPALAGGFFTTRATWEEWLISALQAELLQRLLKVSSGSSKWFNPCRGGWQAPTANANVWLTPFSYGVICYIAIDNQSYCSTLYKLKPFHNVQNQVSLLIRH